MMLDVSLLHKHKVHLELLIQHVHGSGLRQARGPAAVLFQAGEGHPVERRVGGTGSGAEKSRLK